MNEPSDRAKAIAAKFRELAAVERNRHRQRMMTDPIVAAAIKLGDRVFSLPPPARHHTILQHWPDDLSPRNARLVTARGIQGFVTRSGRFVEREEAGVIALAAKQIARLQWPPRLYSEDLW